MRDQDKTKQQLIGELAQLRQRIAELEASEAKRKRAEEALRETEKRLRSIIEQSNDGIVLTDEQGFIVEWNHGAEQIFGLKQDEALGRFICDVQFQTALEEQRTPAVYERLEASVLESLRTGRAPWLGRLLEEEIQRPGWERRIVQASVFPIETNRGFMLGSISRDITELRQAEELLQGERETFFSILQKAPYGVLLIDQNERCLYINPEFTKIAGYTLHDIPTVGDWFHRAFPDPAYREEVIERWKSDTVQRISRVFSVVCESGAVKEVEFRPTLLDSGRAILVLSDVTERTRMERALRESEGRYRIVSELVSDFAYAVRIGPDGDLMPEWTTGAFARITGFTPGEPELYSDWERIVHPDDMPTVAGFMQLLLSGEPATFELRLIAKSGETRWVRDYSRPVGGESQDGSVRIVGAVQDITERKRAEEALRESEERYRTLVEQSLQGLVIITSDSLVFANAASATLIGYTVEELVSFSAKDVGALIHPDDQAFVWGRFRDRLAGKPVPPRYEYRLIRKDGKVRWVEMFSSHIEYGGKPAVQAAFMDITERKQAEEALRESEERYRIVSELVSDFAYAVRIGLDGDLMLEWTTGAFARITGFTPDEPELYSDWERIVHPDDMPTVAGFMQLLLSGAPAAFEFRLIAKSGETRWVRDYSRPVGGESQDGSVRIVGAVQDITERKRAEAERERLMAQVEERARQVQQIVDTVPEGMLLLNANGQVVLTNPLGEKDLVALAKAKVGDTLTHLGDRSLDELLTSPPRGLWHEVTTNGRNFQVLAQSLEVGATPGGWLLVLRDVTQQREIERRIHHQERLAAVGQLAAGIAHDFNNIMATIVLCAQMTAWTKGLPNTAREQMETISQQAKHASSLIQQILDFSRQAVLERRPLDLAPLLKEHVRLLKRTLLESVEIRLDYGPDEDTAPLVVNADPTRMQQMVTNLALNARDAMPEGGILCIGLERIEVKPGESPLLPEMEPGEWARMTVSDTGTGIPPDALPHIFEPFFTTKEPGKGSGLGLAQVYGIVAQHEGRINVETRAGRGTTFTIYLPVHASEPSTTVSLEELPVAVMGRGETVLVVEDNAHVRKALMESLELLNYQVLEATNGREALAVLEQHSDEIDLLLSDVVMPVMGGKALLHALRERGSSVPVVLLTGHLVEKEMAELQAQGLADWLPKPPELEQLAEVIARALGTN